MKQDEEKKPDILRGKSKLIKQMVNPSAIARAMDTTSLVRHIDTASAMARRMDTTSLVRQMDTASVMARTMDTSRLATQMDTATAMARTMDTTSLLRQMDTVSAMARGMDSSRLATQMDTASAMARTMDTSGLIRQMDTANSMARALDTSSLVRQMDTVSAMARAIDTVSSIGGSFDTTSLVRHLDTASAMARTMDTTNLVRQMDTVSAMARAIDTSRLATQMDTASAMARTMDTSGLIRQMDTAISMARALDSARLATHMETASAMARAMDTTRLATQMDTASAMARAMDTTRLVNQMDTIKWVLSSPVLKQMNLFNESIDSNHIFKNISKADYVIKSEYGENSVVYILENKSTHESIPVEDMAATFAITDLIKDLNSDDVISFYNFLIKYPMLGLEHEVGRKIFNEINRIKLIDISNVNVFRVRDRNPNDRQAPLTELEMFEAPYGFASHGRFNVNGQGELYTSESRDVAIMEAVKDEDYKYEIIEWKIIEKMSLLEFTDANSPLIKYCGFQNNTKNNHEYILPNFISQCVKFHGINGIKYSSAVEPSTDNYVFFHFEKKWFQTIKMENDLTLKKDRIPVKQ